MRTLFDNLGPVYPTGAGYQRTDTSRAAGESIVRSLPERQLAVLSALRRLGRATGDEIMAEFGTTNPNRVRPRLSELRILGLIRDTGARRPTPSGGTAIVWEPTR